MGTRRGSGVRACAPGRWSPQGVALVGEVSLVMRASRGPAYRALYGIVDLAPQISDNGSRHMERILQCV